MSQSVIHNTVDAANEAACGFIVEPGAVMQLGLTRDSVKDCDCYLEGVHHAVDWG